MNTASTLELLQQQFPQQLRLNTNDLAKAIGWHPQSIRNYICKGEFPIRTYLEGKNKRYADLRDIADYLDKMRNKRPVGRPTKASVIEAAQQ